MNSLRPTSLSNCNKFGRFVWGFVWLFLFRPTARNMHGWRVFLLKIFGADIGKGAHVYPSAKIWAPWNLEMGEHSCIAENVDCYCVNKVVIGAYATISQYSHLCTASHDYSESSMPLVAAPIKIGAKAWITADVFIGPGVTIGEGSVVTARSSVFADIPSWVVARGNPATPIRARVLDSENPSIDIKTTPCK